MLGGAEFPAADMPDFDDDDDISFQPCFVDRLQEMYGRARVPG